MVKVMAVAEALEQLASKVMATMHDVGSRPQQDDGRSGALGSLEYSGDGERLARRRTQGIAIARRELSDQRRGTHVPWSRSRRERSSTPWTRSWT